MELSCLQDIDNIRAALERREELLNNKEVPKQSEVYANLGDPLGRIVIENMSPLSKELMGVTNPLKGPPNSLWLPPSNRIENKLILIPTSPIDITKALLHQGILEIGSEMEAKLEKNCLKRIKKAASDVSEFERFESERRLKFALECLRQKHQQEIKNIIEQHQSDIFSLREDLHKEYIRGHTEDMLKFPCSCNNIPPKPQENAVQTDPIKEEQRDGNKAAEVAKKQKQINKITKCLYDDFKEHLKIQRHFLACSRITELMHVICAQKLDAQQRIHKVKEIYDKELSRVADQMGYKLIKDKYISVLNNIWKFAQLTAHSTPEHGEFLTEFQNEIQQDLIEIEFQENLCHCCQGVKKLIKENDAEGSQLRGTDGLIIFPHSYGEQVFCTCHSTTENEDADLQQRLMANIKSRKKNDKEEVLWSSISESNVASSTTSKTRSASTSELPIDSNLLLAKKIAELINIEDILATAFSELVDHGFVSNNTLYKKLTDFVSREFKKKFNPDVILNVINTIYTQRTQSLIMGARDSLELVKPRKNTNSSTFATNENGKPSSSPSSTKSYPSSTNTVYSSSNTTTIIGREGALHFAETENNEESEKPNLDVHKEVIRLSEQRRSGCWKSAENEEDIKETNLKESITEQKFWESLVRTPKYLIPAGSRTDPNWIYRKCTEDEWNKLIDQYRANLAKQDASSSSCYECATGESDVEEADPKLLKDVIDAYNECTKVLPHPLGKLQIRSLIRQVEQNEEINKLLSKNRCNKKIVKP